MIFAEESLKFSERKEQRQNYISYVAMLEWISLKVSVASI